jgi:hypothetical protein
MNVVVATRSFVLLGLMLTRAAAAEPAECRGSHNCGAACGYAYRRQGPDQFLRRDERRFASAAMPSTSAQPPHETQSTETRSWRQPQLQRFLCSVTSLFLSRYGRSGTTTQF